MHLSQYIFRQHKPSAQNSGLFEQNHCVTASCTSTSVWQLLPPRKSLVSKTLLQQFGRVCLKYAVQPWLYTMWVPSFWPIRKSIVVVTDSKMMWKCRELSHSGSVCKAQNSVLKAYIHWNRAGGHRSHLAQDGPMASIHKDSNEILGLLKGQKSD